MSVPSREFMVRQAVLNAALTYRGPYNPELSGADIVKTLGMADTLRMWTLGNWVRPSFCDQVRKEYSLLTSRYQERTAA